MKFAEWLKLKENSTDTGQIAAFARPVGIGSRRMYPKPIMMDSNEKRKENNKKDM